MRNQCLLLVFLLWLSPPAIAQSLPFQAWVNADSVNLRAGPGTEQRAVGLADKHTPFAVLERKGDWYRVRPIRLTIPVANVGSDGKVKTACSLSPPELGYKVKPGEQVGLFEKIPEYADDVAVHFPQGAPLWIHSKFLTTDQVVRGVPDSAWAKLSAAPVSAENFAFLAKLREKGGLRYVCLPTTVPSGYTGSPPRTAVKSTGTRDIMQTPSYELKFSKGTSWFTISALESMGSANGEEPFEVQAPLAKFVVSRWTHDEAAGPYWTTGVILVGAFVPRTIAGPANTSHSVPQEIGVRFSPDFTREQITTILSSLRLVKL